MDLISYENIILLATTIFIAPVFALHGAPADDLPQTEDLCSPNPCQNHALCRTYEEQSYLCYCLPGFQGRHCQIEVDECVSEPCQNGGTCEDRVGTYGCLCPTEFTGSNCQDVRNMCSPNPCQHRGWCESRAAGYVCHCPKPSEDGIQYGGEHCEVRLLGCEGHKCQNRGSCSPFILNGTHTYTCSCPDGYTGLFCQTSTIFSFERNGYLRLPSVSFESEVSGSIILSFRTILPGVVLFQRNGNGLQLSLQLQGGRPRLTLRREALAGAEMVLELLHSVTDGEWHSVEAMLRNRTLSLKLLGDPGACERAECQKVATIASPFHWQDEPFQNTFIGGLSKSFRASYEDSLLTGFIGCMRDVTVDSQLIIPEEQPSHSAVNVSPGCSHRDRCVDLPCQNRGQCINLWQSYQCRCPRPYEGHDCEEEYITARFGHEDAQSYAAFSVTEDLGYHLTVSFFLRTRKDSGLLLVLANSSTQYLRVLLEDGVVKLQLNDLHTLKSGRQINDKEIHFVHIEVTQEHMALYISGQKQGQVAVRMAYVQAGDIVYVGGLLDARRTSALGGYFKGCIQDLRINDRRLQVFEVDAAVRSYPLERRQNVTSGCPGDDICRRQPCLNGGTCFSLWDDFACTCSPSVAGRHCEEVKWCERSPCPPLAECRMLSQGYECYSNVTFVNESTVLSYQGNGRIRRSLTDLHLTLRTRQQNAALFQAERGSAFVLLFIQEGYVFMELHSFTRRQAGGAGERPSAVGLSSRRTVSDGQWHSVRVFMEEPWQQTSRWVLVLDEQEEEAFTSNGWGGSLDFLRQGVDIFLGGLGSGAGWSFAGCLGTVELGGIALPFFSSLEVKFPRLQEEQFVRTSALAPLSGCRRPSPCQSNPCLHGGLCLDCACVHNHTGANCKQPELPVPACDDTENIICSGSDCSDTEFICSCRPGFTGDRCEVEVDRCTSSPCLNGGRCRNLRDRFTCVCDMGFAGELCQMDVSDIYFYVAMQLWQNLFQLLSYLIIRLDDEPEVEWGVGH